MLEVNNLTKKFTSYKKKPGFSGALKSLFYRESITKKAVSNFSLQVDQGEMIGLLGPNGAGKTTLMKMFTGIIVPSSGELKVLGHSPWQRHKDFRKKIALVMGQKSQLWWDIPAMDSFLLLQKYYELSQSQFRQRLDFMASLLKVEDLLHIHVRKLSLGERMKMELMASLLHRPQIIFLDEPTIGLDLVAQESIRQFIKTYQKEEKVTVILTSHYMIDIEALCPRIALIFDGTKRFDGPVENFRSLLGHDRSVTFQFKQAVEKSFFEEFNPKWDSSSKKVELLIPEAELGSVSSHILKTYPIDNFFTEKVPIEKVMKSIMENPTILQDGHS